MRAGLIAALALASCLPPSPGDGEPCVVYLDLDNDGHGSATAPADCAIAASLVGARYVASDDDCDDLSPFVNPDQPEVCDGLDNDCDGALEARCPEGCTPDPTYLASGVAKYLDCAAPRSWYDARMLCREHGFELARVDDGLENAHFATVAGDAFAGAPAFFLGGSDAAEPQHWRWTLDGVEFWRGGAEGTDLPGVYASWMPHRPGADDAGAHCLMMTSGFAATDDLLDLHHWFPGRCSERAPFFCERPEPILGVEP